MEQISLVATIITLVTSIVGLVTALVTAVRVFGSSEKEKNPSPSQQEKDSMKD